MRATLYRYPHPSLPGQWLYVGQGRWRDKPHRWGSTSFGQRFKRMFRDTPLPEPVMEHFEARDQDDINQLEIIWMFQYHTWHYYPYGMNLTLPQGKINCKVYA